MIQIVKTLKELDGDTKVVLEKAEKYHLPIFSFSRENCTNVTPVNPKLIKNSNNNSLRSVKSDKTNSIKIAQYCLTNWIKIHSHTKGNFIREQVLEAG